MLFVLVAVYRMYIGCMVYDKLDKCDKNMKFLNRLVSSRWDIAFLQESLEEIVANRKIHFISVKNPFKKQYCCFADPFVLDVTDDSIYLLVEAMTSNNHKGVIAKLTIEKKTMTIADVHVILEEPWHLSFPNIIRKDGRIFVYPESANGKHLYLYELKNNNHGKEYLERVDILCDDVIWDTDINNLFNQNLLFTAHQDNYNLDIYQWDNSAKHYKYSTSLHSSRQNMRLAGALFPLNGKVYIPTQVSGYTYGQAVEIKEIKYDGSWKVQILRKINPPKGLFIDGMHTFNSYKGVTVVDIHRQADLLSWVVSKLVIFKKMISKHK